MKLEDKFFKELMDNLYDGVYFVDNERRINYWNNGAQRITGYTAQEVIGTLCNYNKLDHVSDSGKHLCNDGCPLLATIQDGQPREAEVHLRHAEGYRVPVLVRTSPIRDENQQIIGAVEVFSNNQSMFKIRRKVDQLEEIVLHDALTGLGNRTFLDMKIRSAISEYQRHGLPFGLLFIDIDHFKSVNDTYGHNEGDKVLRNVARTLSGHLRNVDACGRWGGEEFIALLLDLDAQNLSHIAVKLLAMIESSNLKIDGQDVNVTASIGATLVQENDNLESLIERADALMYQSKLGGRNQVTVG